MSSVSADPVAVIDRSLAESLGRLALPPELNAAATYALLGGGKRVRPLLAWHACVAAGSPGERSMPAACAVELVHAFSLVHDDLPALDNDDLRRGRPTLHVHAGEAMAILTGDLLLAAAFGELARVPDPSVAIALAGDLADATIAMIRGQTADTMGPRPASAGDRARALRAIHADKTGALIRAACRMGARCGAAAESSGPVAGGVVDRLTRFGECVGLMFQIADDLVDVLRSTAEAGKRTGKDSAAGKLTYPGVVGVDASRAELATLAASARDLARPLGGAAEGLVALADRIARSAGPSKAPGGASDSPDAASGSVVH